MEKFFQLFDSNEAIFDKCINPSSCLLYQAGVCLAKVLLQTKQAIHLADPFGTKAFPKVGSEKVVARKNTHTVLQ